MIVADQQGWLWMNGQRRSNDAAGAWLVARVYPPTGAVAAEIETFATDRTSFAFRFTDVASSGDRVWVSTPAGLVEIDTATNAAIGVYDHGGDGGGGVAVTDEGVWATNYALERLFFVRSRSPEG